MIKSYKVKWVGVSNSVTWETYVSDSIWVLWNPNVRSTEILLVHKQLIHVKFQNQEGVGVSSHICLWQKNNH